MTSPKADALKALHEARDRLAKPEPLEDLHRGILVAVLDYAIAKVEQIEELKRARRPQSAPEGRIPLTP